LIDLEARSVILIIQFFSIGLNSKQNFTYLCKELAPPPELLAMLVDSLMKKATITLSALGKLLPDPASEVKLRAAVVASFINHNPRQLHDLALAS
jgi:hypothetical protein